MVVAGRVGYPGAPRDEPQELAAGRLGGLEVRPARLRGERARPDAGAAQHRARLEHLDAGVPSGSGCRNRTFEPRNVPSFDPPGRIE